MELRQYLLIIRKWLWLIVISIGIAGGSSYLASQSATPLYATKTTLMVGRVTQNPDPSASEINTGEQLAFTYMQLVLREPVLRGTIEQLGLEMSWEQLAGRVRASVIPRTQLLEISVTDNDPLRAKVFADTLAQQLILQSPTTPSNISQEQLDFTQQQIASLQARIEEAQKEIVRLQQELDAANSARQIQELQNQLSVLDTKISNWQDTYSQLLVSLQGGEVNALSVIEEARLPGRPFSPNIPRNVALASVIGLVLSVGGIFLIEYLDDTVKSADEVARATDLATLGRISQIKNNQGGYEEKLVTLNQPLSPIAEAYRVLRTNLKFSALDNPINSMMLTSPNVGEGKTTTIANLAVVLAQSDLRIILVDADLRRPALHQMFNLSNRSGLTQALVGPTDLLPRCLQETSVKNLRVLTSGPLPPNPADLLGSERMRVAIRELEEHADLVLFDCPPVLPIADAAILGTRVDGVILVSDASKTRSKEARAAVESLRHVNVNLLGVVLNRVTNGSGGYNYYASYYSQELSEGRIIPRISLLSGLKSRKTGEPSIADKTSK